jgi:hypothetical protein
MRLVTTKDHHAKRIVERACDMPYQAGRPLGNEAVILPMQKDDPDRSGVPKERLHAPRFDLHWLAATCCLLK